MLVKGITEEDLINYKVPSMYIAFPHCTFKCEKECGIKGICQNFPLAKSKNLDIPMHVILEHYLDNPITHAIVLAGLEPLDSFNDVLDLLKNLREHSNDPYVIFTGYTEDECQDQVEILKQYPNVIVKFGRFIPNDISHFDEVLGINLASRNQYAKKIS